MDFSSKLTVKLAKTNPLLMVVPKIVASGELSCLLMSFRSENKGRSMNPLQLQSYVAQVSGCVWKIRTQTAKHGHSKDRLTPAGRSKEEHMRKTKKQCHVSICVLTYLHIRKVDYEACAIPLLTSTSSASRMTVMRRTRRTCSVTVFVWCISMKLTHQSP